MEAEMVSYFIFHNVFSISYRSTGGYRAIETDLELNIYIVRLVNSTPANSICSERHSRVLVDDFQIITPAGSDY